MHLPTCGIFGLDSGFAGTSSTSCVHNVALLAVQDIPPSNRHSDATGRSDIKSHCIPTNFVSWEWEVGGWRNSKLNLPVLIK